MQVWYPAAESREPRPFRTSEEVTIRRSRLTLVKTHAAAQSPLAREPARLPLIVFCPAWSGRRDQNTFLVEELASHGFIVVGIDHPYSSEWTIFPDGRRVDSKLGNWVEFGSDEQFAKSLVTIGEQLRIRTADARFVLDEMLRLDRDDPAGLFTGRIDADRIGITGHSFGGAAAAEGCWEDDRFRAGINLDGLFAGKAAESGVEQPLMFMNEEVPPPSADQIAAATGADLRRMTFIDEHFQRVNRSLDRYGGYCLSVRGTRHMNFSDSPLWNPIKSLTAPARLNPSGPCGSSTIMPWRSSSDI